MLPVRILIYSINYAPELTGIGKYNAEMAEWLANKGHDVAVITAPPYYPWWKVQAPYRSWSYFTEQLNGVKVYRCPVWVPTRLSGLKRLIHLASFALSSLPVMLRQIFRCPDVLMVIEPPLMCSPTALLVSKLSGAKSWLHVQDLEVDAAFDLGLLPSGHLRHAVLFVERQLMRIFGRVSTISTNMLNRLVDKGVRQGRAALFPNWVDTGVIFPVDSPPLMREELGVPANTVVALYSGNMGEKQGLEIVLKAARQHVSDERIQYILCGDGPVRSRLQAEYASLANVLWLPLQPVEKLNDLLNVADIHLLPQRADAADLVMPSKLTGMLASGRPVIATSHAGTHLAEVVSNCGIVVSPDDVTGFVNAMSRLVQNKVERDAYGAAAREYAEKHMAKASVLGRLEDSLSALVSK